jgi:hypothetical protein
VLWTACTRAEEDNYSPNCNWTYPEEGGKIHAVILTSYKLILMLVLKMSVIHLSWDGLISVLSLERRTGRSQSAGMLRNVLLSTSSRLVAGPQPPVQCLAGLFPGNKTVRREFDQLVPRPGKRGSLHPLPHMAAVCVDIVWFQYYIRRIKVFSFFRYSRDLSEEVINLHYETRTTDRVSNGCAFLILVAQVTSKHFCLWKSWKSRNEWNALYWCQSPVVLH